jgi:Type II CAAX prenyl endopeptidase Rce1-like
MRILTAAIISEGFLLIAGELLLRLLSLSVDWRPSLHALALGSALTLPLLLANEIAWKRSLRYPTSTYSRFSREIIIPLCQRTPPLTALIIAILSGGCEEFFFRGALHSAVIVYLPQWASCVITSLLFAAVHFIGNFRRFAAMIPLYGAVGMYLWVVAWATGSLFSVAILHGLYNFTVIMRVRQALRSAQIHSAYLPLKFEFQ